MNDCLPDARYKSPTKDDRIFANKRPYNEAGLVAGTAAGQCKSEYYANPRYLIDAEIEYHNARARELCALREALPGRMTPEAEKALADLITRGHNGTAAR